MPRNGHISRGLWGMGGGGVDFTRGTISQGIISPGEIFATLEIPKALSKHVSRHYHQRYTIPAVTLYNNCTHFKRMFTMPIRHREPVLCMTRKAPPFATRLFDCLPQCQCGISHIHQVCT